MNPDPDSRSPIPNSRKLIFLIGMPAAGKTYWGRKIAEAYAIGFIDLDVFVSGQERASIPALFAQYGENGFREREHKYLRQLIGSIEDSTIIACGGGTPCFNDNLQLMKDAGTIIYLHAEVPYLLNNINSSDEVRPLLKGRGDMNVYLESLLQKRKGFYEQAHHILPTKNISLITFDEIISSCISRH